MSSITPFPASRRKPEAKPKPPIVTVREAVTAEERAAADSLQRAAAAIQRIYGPAWATPHALAQAPGLIEAAERALETLKELVGQ